MDRIVVHARKAWLSGLSPKENRTVPPLQHERVIALKRAFPELRIETNGGVRDLGAAVALLRDVDGVMVGRAAYEDPFVLAGVDGLIYGDPGEGPSRAEAVEGYLPYVEARRAAGTPLPPLVKPLIGLVRGARGGRAWRRTLSEGSVRPGAGPELIAAALVALPDDVRHARPEGAVAAVATAAAGGDRRRLVDSRA